MFISIQSTSRLNQVGAQPTYSAMVVRTWYGAMLSVTDCCPVLYAISIGTILREALSTLSLLTLMGAH
jgi:hypothetical protein